jgi:chemotaxis methyl-accepting protein methylase
MAVCDGLAHNAANHGNAGNGNGNGNANGSAKSGARNGGIVDSASNGASVSGAPVSIHIVGSDLLPGNIKIADRGIYPQSALEGLPPATIRNYFSKSASPVTVARDSENEETNEEEDRFLSQAPWKNGAADAPTASSASVPHLSVKPRLRSLVTFNCMNLARPGYIGRFDCILCMDVLPHFSRVQRLALLERLHLYLEPGGYLFLSQTEKLGTSNLNFRPETFDGYTFHRKPLAASAAYGR